MTTKNTLKRKITKILRGSVSGTKSAISGLIPPSFTSGKLYEAYVLGLVCENLKNREGCSLVLKGGTKIVLKSSPGPINVSYPHIEVFKGNAHIANIWTDIEFQAMSFSRTAGAIPASGDFHEIDVAVVIPSCAPRPAHDEILIAVECKNTPYKKSFLREILGVRRELSVLSARLPTTFSVWPASEVPANPPSCIVVYSSAIDVSQFERPGNTFGIQFFHETL